MRRTAQLMIIKPTYCTSCYAGTQPRVRLGVMPSLTLLPMLLLLPTAATRQVLDRASTGVAVPGRNAASYRGASDGVRRTIPQPRADAAFSETPHQDYSPGIHRDSRTAPRSLVTNRGDGAYWVLLLGRSQEEEATGD